MDELIDAVRKLVKGKGRYHTEQNYKAVVDALDTYDACAAKRHEKVLIGQTLLSETLSTLLWLYRRLPRGYGRPPFIEQPIEALAKHVGIDVADCLAERGEDPLAAQRRQSEAQDVEQRQASEVRAAFSSHQVEWSHDLQHRLIEMGKGQDVDSQAIMAEAACLLSDLTGQAAT